MSDTIVPDELDQAINDMFEAFSVSTAIRQGRTMNFHVWSDRHHPLSHDGGFELNPRNPAHRRFLNNVNPHHIWTIQPSPEPLEGSNTGCRVRKKTVIMPGSLRRGQPKLPELHLTQIGQDLIVQKLEAVANPKLTLGETQALLCVEHAGRDRELRPTDFLAVEQGAGGFNGIVLIIKIGFEMELH